jgi:hypothetical protein
MSEREHSDSPPSESTKAVQPTESIEKAVQRPGDLNLTEEKALSVVPVTVNPTDAERLPVTGLTPPPPDAGPQGSAEGPTTPPSGESPPASSDD